MARPLCGGPRRALQPVQGCLRQRSQERHPDPLTRLQDFFVSPHPAREPLWPQRAGDSFNPTGGGVPSAYPPLAKSQTRGATFLGQRALFWASVRGAREGCRLGTGRGLTAGVRYARQLFIFLAFCSFSLCSPSCLPSVLAFAICSRVRHTFVVTFCMFEEIWHLENH